MADEWTLQRRDRDRLDEERAARLRMTGPSPSVVPSLACITSTRGAYPTPGGNLVWYVVLPVLLSGARGEGLPVAVAAAPGASWFLAANVGTGAPPQGSPVVVDFPDGSAPVFRYDATPP